MPRVGPFNLGADKFLSRPIRCGDGGIVRLVIGPHTRIEIAERNTPSAVGQAGCKIKIGTQVHFSNSLSVSKDSAKINDCQPPLHSQARPKADSLAQTACPK